MAAHVDINSQMFFALRVSEKSRVPFLFMSAPGMGKSTTVEKFAQYAGYKMEILRGNSTSESEIMGYDIVDPTPGAKSTKHLRPSWFGNVMKNTDNGEKTLLFVDEITTCPEHVQSALLHLIFERKVGNEAIPDDTLIVSAGNYSQSLGSSFGLIPPLMNRFCIFNIIPTKDDVEGFILHHRGATLGTVASLDSQIFDKFKNLDKKAIELPAPNIVDRVYEVVEMAINDTYQMLSTPSGSGRSTGCEGKIDIKVTDVQSIYSDVDNDDPLCGFVSLRTLGYAVKTTMAVWQCFGKSGLTSKSYLNILNGLIGIGLTRPSNSSSVKVEHVGQDFFNRIGNAVNEIEKIVKHNVAIDKVIDFYKDFINNYIPKSNSIIDKQKAGILIDKIKEINKDKSLSDITKPIDSSIFETIFKSIRVSMKSALSFNLPTANATVSVTDLAAAVTEWNTLSDLFEYYGKFIEDPVRGYEKSDLEMVSNFKSLLKSDSRKIKNAVLIYTEGIDEKARSIIPTPRIDYIS